MMTKNVHFWVEYPCKAVYLVTVTADTVYCNKPLELFLNLAFCVNSHVWVSLKDSNGHVEAQSTR